MGRPVEFDRFAALDAAMQLFWRQGVRKTSLCDLTAAMGLSRSSLYNSFGTKQKLVEEAIDRYSAAQAAKLAESARGRSLRATLRSLVAAIASDNNGGRGCLLGNCAAELGSCNISIARCVRRGIAAQADVFAHTIARAQVAGEVDAKREPRELAYFIASTITGLRVLAKTGVPRSSIIGAGEVALSTIFAPADIVQAQTRRRAGHARKAARSERGAASISRLK